jgi:hypothetical protein
MADYYNYHVQAEVYVKKMAEVTSNFLRQACVPYQDLIPSMAVF